MNNAVIKIKLISSMRGKIIAHFFFPDKSESLITFCTWGTVWHRNETISSRSEAWLKSANKSFLTASEIRRLRKNGEISFTAPTRERMLSFWKEYHTDRNGMWQRPGTPNLKNV